MTFDEYVQRHNIVCGNHGPRTRRELAVEVLTSIKDRTRLSDLYNPGNKDEYTNSLLAEILIVIIKGEL